MWHRDATTRNAVSDATHAAEARHRDENDRLAAFALEFHTPQRADGRTPIYFCGHSLGLQPKSVASFVEHELAAVGVAGKRERNSVGEIPRMRMVREQQRPGGGLPAREQPGGAVPHPRRAVIPRQAEQLDALAADDRRVGFTQQQGQASAL